MTHPSNAFSRSERLSLDGDRHAFAERLDSDVSRISLSVEQSFTKFNSQAWSAALSSARAQEQALKKGLSLYRHNCPLTPRRDLEYNELTGDVFPDSLATCSNALWTIKRQLQKNSDQSFEQREQERDILIKKLDQSSLTSDLKRAAILRKNRHSEKSRALALKLQSIRTTPASVGMSRIEIPVHPEHDPKTCTEWQLIDLPSDVLHHLQQRNRKHFSQAFGTPFTVPPLSTDHGFTGAGEATTKVLEDKYSLPPGTDHSQALRLLANI